MSQGQHDLEAGPVLHVLPYDLARGAQRYARALVDRLDTPARRHLILTIFRSEPIVLRADIDLDVPMGPLRGIGVDPRAVLRLRKALNDYAPAALVAHGGEPAKYAALSAPRSLPIVYLTIGSAHPGLGRMSKRKLHHFYTHRSDIVVAVSNDLADEARTIHGVPPDRVVVIPNGREADLFRPRKSRPPGPVRLAWVGHLDQGKRPWLFVDVVAALLEKGREVQGWMVGEGPMYDAIRPAAEAVGIEMLGRREDVHLLLPESDLLVLTSRPPEGMPGVLIEAGLAGLPAVSTRIPGSNDVIENGRSGLLVDIDDFGELVAAVDQLVMDEAARSSMGQRARDICLARFTIDATADRWRAVLSEVVTPGRVDV